VWSGHAGYARNFDRAVSPQLFQKFLHPSVQLFSLQKGALESQAKDFFSNDQLIDLAQHLDHFADTAAAIHNLDLIIMTDSGVAHLAASMGKPVWNLLGHVAFWLYGMNEKTTPWYPTMRLYRQPALGNWETVFNAARNDLDKLANVKH
jgi:ADP-heptose:LPS heptosyltransferase